MIQVSYTTLDGKSGHVLRIQLEPFQDHRGKYVELFNELDYKAVLAHFLLSPPDFVQDDISVSKKNVLRGIHGDTITWKLISCLEGQFMLVIVNLDPTSIYFRKWESFDMTEDAGVQILVPPKFGVAHLVLSDRAIFHYKQSTYYRPRVQFTRRYDDPLFNIDWPVKDPIVSERDSKSYG